MALGHLARASDKSGELKLGLGATFTEDRQFNQTLNSLGFKENEALINLTAEIDQELQNSFYVGFRYNKKLFGNDTLVKTPDVTQNYLGSQDSMAVMLRYKVLNTDFVTFDFGIGGGGSNTSIVVKSTSTNGTWLKKGPSLWYASPYALVNLSSGIGFRYVYLGTEVGYEYNPVGQLKANGDLPQTQLNLSGTYINFVLIIRGKGMVK